MGRRRWMMNIVAIATVLACFSGAQTMAGEVNEDKHIIGIDLGTTYSCVGVYRNGKVEILPNDQGNRITPSMVGWTSTGDRLVGDAAKNQATMNAENTVFDVKRLIGRDFHDKSVQNDMKMFPFKVVNKDGKPHVQVKTHGETKTFAPEEVSAMVLQKMKTIAEEALSTEIKHAVVTVPAYFNDAQRQATKDAGKIAGLVVERIINEPTAASLAIETTRSEEAKNILVFDLGGGTFDVTILTVDDEVYEVLSTNGDTHLGGEDFDQRVMAYYVKKIRKQTGKDISGDKTAMQKLRKEVERAKRTLSSQHQTRLEIDSLVSGFDFSETLTRARFEDLNMDLFQKTLRPVENALKDAKLKKKDIDEIVLVGGSTRIPKVRQLISDFFDGKQVDLSVNPDEAVAYGAALQGAILNGKYTNAVVLDVMPLSLGIETVGGMMTKMIDRNTNIPAKKTSVFSTNQDNQPAVSIKVFEGERALTKDNHALGEFELTGIPPAPRGVPQIEVTFEVDANSILQVSAREKGTGKTESLTITRDSKSLSEDEIERMIQEAEEFAEEDKRTAARIAASNKLEGYCYNLKNQLKDEAGLGGKLSAAETASLEEVISETLDWLDENSDASLEELEEKQKDVEAVVNPVLRTVYEGSQSGQRDDNDFDFDDDGFDDFDEDHDEL